MCVPISLRTCTFEAQKELKSYLLPSGRISHCEGDKKENKNTG